VTAVIRDITDKKNLEAEREKILSDLELKNIELEKIIYTASHDLRSPLLNLHGFSKRLEKAVHEIRLLADGQEKCLNNREAIGKIIDERINNALKYIISSVSRIDSVINGLLRISRSGNRMPVKSAMDMNVLVEKILDSIRYQIETSGADVRVDDLPGCMADFGQITQVFSNILDNAIKYRDPEKQLVITVKGTAENGIARYSISDNGIGIAQENHNRIWEMFYRINPGNEIPGDGLGLAISKKIIDRHGGSIYLESEPGQGSTFYVCLEYAGVQ
jgi:signal transduction histidine kinase